jgi:tetratricopeptide (TPR) repeat protein
MLSSGPSFSPHNDVLNASPSTESETFSLVEELKRRGRVSVTTQRYPDAKDLYGKAIEVLSTIDNDASKKDLAILHSNRALCLLQMNNAADSYDDATSATCSDPTYVKGFWRLGQACMALSKTQEAIDSFKAALTLDENNKALKKELLKAERQLVKDIEEAARKEKEEEENADKPPPPAPVVKKTSTVSASATPSASDKSVAAKSEKGDFSKSDHVRGYKVVDGKKTSFFHHEQTEEEKRLIGDITPKLLDPAQIPTSNTTQDKDVSVWNKAGTWEEKDVTKWALESIKNKVMEASYTLPEGSPDPNACVKVVDVSKLVSSKKAGGSAHASVAKVRGKKKYIFEFTVCVHWEITIGSGDICKGKMTFFDVDGTHEIGEGYDVTDYVVDAGAPADASHLLRRFVKDSGLRSAVEGKLDEWIGLFQETY